MHPPIPCWSRSPCSAPCRRAPGAVASAVLVTASWAPAAQSPALAHGGAVLLGEHTPPLGGLALAVLVTSAGGFALTFAIIV